MEAVRLEQDAFLYSETDLAEAMWSNPSLEHASEAGGFLRAYRHYCEEMAACIAGYNSVIADYEAARDQKAEQYERKLAWLKTALHAHYVHSGQKKLDYPDGALSMRKGSERVEIENEVVFTNTHKQPFVHEVSTRKIDKAAIKKHVKAGGEIPEGADLVRGEDTFVVKPNTKTLPPHQGE